MASAFPWGTRRDSDAWPAYRLRCSLTGNSQGELPRTAQGPEKQASKLPDEEMAVNDFKPFLLRLNGTGPVRSGPRCAGHVAQAKGVAGSDAKNDLHCT